MKSLLLYGLTSGLAYAIAMSAFEVYADGEDFHSQNLWSIFSSLEEL